ncbi:MAG: hypothetical protein PUP93_20210 [Rhizonema sp. NSF051]|nr:hypothetical protein [Rhizonema sp. NSF051]
MTKPTSTSEITQESIDNLLAQLQQLRSSIATEREKIAPLEANLAEAFNEFQAVVGGLRRSCMHLQAEIFTLRAQINKEDDTQEQDERNNFLDIQEEKTTESLQDPEAVEKDMLLQHIFRVLEPDVNDEDADLLANLQGLCSDSTVSLAEVLEKLHWGIVWTKCSSHESLTEQQSRLTIWKQALNRQLQNLQRATELLYQDQRYGLWQQRQKGQKDWHNFLNQCKEQQEDQNYELQAELNKLKDEWARITSI